jgi:hydrogenase maturation protein HypF
MVENGVQEPVIGVALDGTGYGSDGTIWGGEFLVVDYRSFTRAGHLEPVPMPGGAAAIERPYRMAFSYVYSLLGQESLDQGLPFLREVSGEEIEVMKQQLERGLNAPLTSSCGRLFDGVSALLGIRGTVDYEAQAAVELEMAATGHTGQVQAYPYSIGERNGVRVVELKELFQAIIHDIRQRPTPAISLRFHHTVARMVAEMCLLVSRETGLCKVALSGGVFQNRLLQRLAVAALESKGFEVLTHALVPTNDGDISLGQAVVALSSLA